MNAKSGSGWACAVLAVLAILMVGSCGLGAAILTAGTAFGIGRAAEDVASELPSWTSDLLRPGPLLGAPLFAEALVEELVQSSAVVGQALAEARSNREVREALGAPVEVGALIRISRFTEDGRSGQAELTLELKGPRASGELAFVAHRGPQVGWGSQPLGWQTLRIFGIEVTVPEGEWVFDKLSVTLPSGEIVTILPAAQ
ncbi:MAG TPA: cytochrome c oxidase assembly factor Coa1 family protein [Anaerolineales bacterium]|nr:cytochrome c oxidase assembly factor Coa1 family protein [Anaerolineales bacterium]